MRTNLRNRFCAPQEILPPQAQPSPRKTRKSKRVGRGPWSATEDEILRTLVTSNGEGKWSRIAAKIPGRIGKQCRERWINHLRPNINHSPWTIEEDRIILSMVRTVGTRWVEIAKRLNQRTDNAVKNRFYSKLQHSTDLPNTSKPTQTSPSITIHTQETNESTDSTESSSSSSSSSNASDESYVARVRIVTRPKPHTNSNPLVVQPQQQLQPQVVEQGVMEAVFALCELRSLSHNNNKSLGEGPLLRQLS